MKHEVEESVVDDLLQGYLDEERHDASELEGNARATLQQLVENADTPRALEEPHFSEAISLLRRLLAATDDRPGVLARALGYRATQNDAENRAMMRVFEYLHDDPLPVGAKGGRRPRGRGHRVSHDSDTCLLCGASASTGAAWDTDCPEKPPAPIRSKTTCAMAVAEAANKAGLINTKRRPLDSDAVLKMYDRWQREGSPREREHERLLRRSHK